MKHICRICKKKFKSKRELFNHLLTKHCFWQVDVKREEKFQYEMWRHTTCS